MPQSNADELQSIPMSPSLSQCFGKAKDFAREQAHRAMTLEHLLLALTEDADAAGVLRACNVDIDRLGTDVSGYLGGLLEDMRATAGAEPGPDAELLRVVEAARQAATQSRRRTIDGAIVLAAIVGGANSAAAGVLTAHGLTFEEAIKTLQKASAQARSKQFSPTAQRAPGDRSATEQLEKIVAAPAAASPPATVATPNAAADASATSQTADDFLAAARARIQHRNSSAAAAKPELHSQATASGKLSQAEPEDLPLMSLSAFTANRASAGAEAMPPLDGLAPPVAGIPPAGPSGPPPQGSPDARLPPPPAGPAPTGPPEGLPLSADGLPPLPPVPPRSGGAPPLPSRTERADGAGPPPHKRSPAGNSASGQRRPSAEGARQPARSGILSTRGQRAAAGPLMEAIPRKMRVGRAASAQVRIGRDKVDSLMQLLTGSRVQHHPEAGAVRVLSVRLRAPDGGFAIEPDTPETQWIETGPGQLQDDHVAWQWTITPLWRGRWPLYLMVSIRAVGRDGIAAEQALPDYVIDVTVRRNRLRRLVRWVASALLLSVGAMLGWLSQDKLGQDLADVVVLIVKNILGLLRTSGFLAG